MSHDEEASSLASKPTCIICLGMAGSGKTTFVQASLFQRKNAVVTVIHRQRLNAYLHARKTPPYVINLDPAVHEVPYPVNIGKA